MAGLAADIARMKLAKKGRSEPAAKAPKEDAVDLEAEFGFGFPEDNERDFPDLSFTTRSLPNAFKAMERTPLPQAGEAPSRNTHDDTSSSPDAASSRDGGASPSSSPPSSQPPKKSVQFDIAPQPPQGGRRLRRETPAVVGANVQVKSPRGSQSDEAAASSPSPAASHSRKPSRVHFADDSGDDDGDGESSRKAAASKVTSPIPVRTPVRRESGGGGSPSGIGAVGAGILGMMNSGSTRLRDSPSARPPIPGSPRSAPMSGERPGAMVGRMPGRPSADRGPGRAPPPPSAAAMSPGYASDPRMTDGHRSLDRRIPRPSADAGSSSGAPSSPLVFNLPKHLGTFNFNVVGRQILVMRRFKRLLPSEFGYDIDELVLVLCNDIAFVAVSAPEAPNTLTLLHRPCVRQAVLIERAESMYGPCAFRLNFGNLDKFILKASTLEEVSFWIEKLNLYRVAQSRIQLAHTQSAATSTPPPASPSASQAGPMSPRAAPTPLSAAASPLVGSAVDRRPAMSARPSQSSLAAKLGSSPAATSMKSRGASADMLDREDDDY